MLERFSLIRSLSLVSPLSSSANLPKRESRSAGKTRILPNVSEFYSNFSSRPPICRQILTKERKERKTKKTKKKDEKERKNSKANVCSFFAICLNRRERKRSASSADVLRPEERQRQKTEGGRWKS